MATVHIEYKGNLRTQATHLQSNTIIETDAPLDNHGKGEKFSPTDLVASSLGSCMMTFMGIAAERYQIDLTGMTCEVTKIMSQVPPRRIAEIIITFQFPKNLNIGEKEKSIIERSTYSCAVGKSLHPDLKQTITFDW